MSSMKAPLHMAIVTLDHHLSSACEAAAAKLAKELPGLQLTMHAAADWAHKPHTLVEAQKAIKEVMSKVDQRITILKDNKASMLEHHAAYQTAQRAARDAHTEFTADCAACKAANHISRCGYACSPRPKRPRASHSHAHKASMKRCGLR
jgi:magnesium chelatase subunit H